MTKKQDFDCQRYRSHLRPHTPEERAKLEASVRAEGCRDALVLGVLDGERFLVDGFHRKEICDSLGLEYKTRKIPFATEEELLAWMENNARARRNQTHTERLYYLGGRYNRAKGKQGGERNGAGRGRKSKAQSEPLISSVADRIAEEEHTSRETVKRAGKLADKLDEACRTGLAFLKWPILTERIRYSHKLLDELIYQGAGETQGPIEALLAEGSDRPLAPAVILKAIGANPVVDGPDAPTMGKLMKSVEEYVRLAKTPTQLADLVATFRILASKYEKQIKEMGK